MNLLYFAGRAYLELGEAEQAAGLFRRALARWPQHPWAEQMRALLR